MSTAQLHQLNVHILYSYFEMPTVFLRNSMFNFWNSIYPMTKICIHTYKQRAKHPWYHLAVAAAAYEEAYLCRIRLGWSQFRTLVASELKELAWNQRDTHDYRYALSLSPLLLFFTQLKLLSDIAWALLLWSLTSYCCIILNPSPPLYYHHHHSH